MIIMSNVCFKQPQYVLRDRTKCLSVLAMGLSLNNILVLLCYFIYIQPVFLG